MLKVAVSQRVDVVTRPHGPPERRDALDQTWVRFLAAAGLSPVLMPNHAPTALTLFDDLPVQGLILTGGNDLFDHGGDAPERDVTETALLAAARSLGLPVIGVCRGMQVLQRAFGVALAPVEGHVAPRQTITVGDQPRVANAFHTWGARQTAPDLTVWALAQDGVVKAVRHAREPLVGLMWHPERLDPFDPGDVALFRQMFFGPRGAPREAAP
ncbi:gamma-glutamyl-gamma-aminobutyrate hydrolase family protein [Caulobacter sp. RL271]|uniref:Gamma-glutamyl-gamma-aminobutyrate hydrolase family protein n=1 Tax=Caulobacter segnis TaxID=88688 RepID=A0ABY4ZS04_9CAUL|nr:gamma-glutamyl-gamma-aminobutyrate hydrolase family protein [Caulobacter segnis]USQ95290.1 gamma-glutamyl-gamma-aminobutyrate hydrolase family protein [Caulobacter segnis]